MDDAEVRRHVRRTFIREHHPDRGGDPDFFRRGLERLESPGPPDNDLVFHKRRRGVVRLVGWWRDRRTRNRRPPRVT